MVESKFLVSVNYPLNVIYIPAVSTITGDVNLYLHGCVSLLAPECSVSLRVWVNVWNCVKTCSF